MTTILLRPATIQDLAILEKWDSQPHVVDSDPNDGWNWAVELTRTVAWREQLIAEADGRPIGFIQIIDPHEEETHYWGAIAQNQRAIDIWIGAPNDLGKGYGTTMMQLALARCFDVPAVTAVWIDPLESNHRAHRFYERLGFQFVEHRTFGEDLCRVYKLSRNKFFKNISAQHGVIPTSLSDLNIIFELFEQSIRYQETKGYNVWKNYDRGAIVRDIENNRQYKIEIDNQVAIVFSIAYEDKIIWRHLDQGKSVYLHRIVVNPVFKGRKLFGKILEWVIMHGKAKGLDSIRMDTWADNPNLQHYYQQFGFRIVENFTTPNTPDLPEHNRNLAITLLEYPLDKKV